MWSDPSHDIDSRTALTSPRGQTHSVVEDRIRSDRRRAWTVPQPDRDAASEKPLRVSNKDSGYHFLGACRSLAAAELGKAHHSGALVIRPAKTPSQQCTHHWGCVSEAILQMSLLCILSPGWAELATVCVCVWWILGDKLGRLWYFSSCFLYAAAPPRTGHFKSCSPLPPQCVCVCVCVAVQRDLVVEAAVKHSRGSRGTLHLSLWILSVERTDRSTIGGVWHCMCWHGGLHSEWHPLKIFNLVRIRHFALQRHKKDAKGPKD